MTVKTLVIVGIAIAAIAAVGAALVLSNRNAHQGPSTAPEESHGTMQMEQIAQRSGRTNDVVHDNRIMMEVNSYAISDRINNPSIKPSLEEKFLTVDLSVRSIEQTLTLSPNLFKLQTGIGEIAPSIVTSSVDAGLKQVYLPKGQAIRTFLIFESPSFGETPAILEYSDRSSSFSITLDQTGSSQSKLVSELKPAYTVGQSMKNGSLRLKTGDSAIDRLGGYVPRPDNGAFKVSLTFQNEGNSTIRVDPSYVFIQNEKYYIYGINGPASNNLASPLKLTDLQPGSAITGDVVIEVPKESASLALMYAGPNNTFLVRIS